MVELTLQPNDAERRLCVATTWDTSAIVVWGLPQLQEGFMDAMAVLVDRFCTDYLAANPSDGQSISGGGASWDPEHRIGR